MPGWNELPMGEAAGHHEPGCNGHCKGQCAADMALAWHRAYDQDRKPTVEVPITRAWDLVDPEGKVAAFDDGASR